LLSLTPARAELIGNPLYSQITTSDRLRVFMKHHVFAE